MFESVSNTFCSHQVGDDQVGAVGAEGEVRHVAGEDRHVGSGPAVEPVVASAAVEGVVAATPFRMSSPPLPFSVSLPPRDADWIAAVGDIVAGPAVESGGDGDPGEGVAHDPGRQGEQFLHEAVVVGVGDSGGGCCRPDRRCRECRWWA